MSITAKQKKRYNLQIPDGVYRQLAAMAEQREETVTEVMRKCVKLGLIAMEFERSGGELVVRRGDREQTLVLVG